MLILSNLKTLVKFEKNPFEQTLEGRDVQDIKHRLLGDPLNVKYQ